MRRIYAWALFAISLIAVIVAGIQSHLEQESLLGESGQRLASLSEGVEESVRGFWEQNRPERIRTMAERLARRQKIAGLAVCPDASHGSPLGREQVYGNLPQDICRKRVSEDLWTVRAQGELLQVYSRALDLTPGGSRARLVLAQPVTSLRGTWLQVFFRTFVLTALAGLVLTLLIASQLRLWIKLYLRFLHQMLRSLLAGKKPSMRLAPLKNVAGDAEMGQLSQEIDSLAAKILTLPARKPKGSEEPSWLASLRESVGTRVPVVFANREPYIHNRKQDSGGERIEVTRPASGLVTALEPVLRTSGGLWIAHGSGSADFEVANADGEVAVPPGNPKYTLKRVRLTAEEEQGYYYGFANEGFWPLCHLAHNRPTFRHSDWQHYKTVNQRFCDETPEGVLSDDALMLVQDYHFALLPRMLRERAASGRKATHPRISLFWHIPWPNPEAFGICPWNKELLRGMLGADVIGFHTQYHCNNFLETCDRYLEARIDWERFSVTMEKHETLIRAFPIGIDTAPVRALSEPEREELKRRYGIAAPIVAVGVDRVDYTKGLIERLESVERFLEKRPEYVGRFTLAQMGSPSRTHIPAYRMLGEQLLAAVERINARFGKDEYKPIVLIPHHEWDAIQYFYQLGDLCLVTSLHDGMNLVAKEYIWCQQPERGALILSKFTGAARELTDAFIVNPYDIEEMADAIHASLVLPQAERTRRMRAMRAKVESHNAFHWASDLIRVLVQDVRPERDLPAAALRALASSSSNSAPSKFPRSARSPQ